MKSAVLAAAAVALPALAAATKCKPFVSSAELQADIKLSSIVSGSYRLQNIADTHGGNRVFGSGGHNATVDWLYNQLKKTGYYDVVKQPFSEIYSTGSSELTVDGEPVDSAILTYTPAGTAMGATVVSVANLGCVAEDFPAAVEGAVALISRGECTFGVKSVNAAAAGAVGAIIYNSEAGELAGTLGAPFLDYAPTIGITRAEGLDLVAALEAGDVTVDFVVEAVNENRVNYNVIAETKGGDHDNVLVLGGHSDSVTAGPGINDDGSGTVGVFAVAKALTEYKIKNAVRFAFWGAEEYGKLGSYYYIKQLNGSDTELAKMRAYLNFDMIASPNYVYGVYDGSGDAFNVSGPAGSDVIEADFEDFYTSKGQNSVPSEFTGRSDYAAFIENGIPSGGLFTGAEVLKTEKEYELFGGEVGVAYDVNYHQAGDDIDNLNLDAFLINTKAIANSVAKYAMSWETIPEVDITKRSYDADRAKLLQRAGVGSHGHGNAHAHSGPCGGGSAM